MIQIARSVAEAADFVPSAVAIGNFDGVHIAHGALIGMAREGGKRLGAAPTVLTFDPHPAKIVAPERAPKLLTTIEDRCRLLLAAHVEQILILPFTQEVAKLTPEEFVAQIIVAALRAKLVVVGENFRFGHKQAGDTKVLAQLGEKYGFETQFMQVSTCRGRIVSSSNIRGFIESGNILEAWRFLMRPHCIVGDVVQGRGVGTKQTVPTLNLHAPGAVLPRTGVYVTRTRRLRDGWRWNSITNIGYRPTFSDGAPELSVETYLLDPFDGDTTERIEVEFLHRVRDERKFESPEALKKQILRDVGRAQAYFRHNRNLRGGDILMADSGRKVWRFQRGN